MAKNVDPLVRQIRALLNSYGQMSDKTLDTSGGSQDQATGAYNFPILHKILGMGYGYGQNQGMDSWIHSFDTDKDAIGQAITNLRSGFALGQDHLRTHNPYGEDSASNNLYRSLIDERVKAGMSKQEAYDSVRNAVMGELTASKATPVVDKATDKYSTLNPAEQQTLAARSVGANTDSPNPNFDPAAMAQAQMLQQYYDRGSNDISQYGQIANIMGGMVPEQLQPLYQLMTQQRLQEMTNNLNQTYGQMQNAPYIQMLKDAAADFRASAKGSGSGGSNGPLGALRQAAGGTGGGLSGYASNGGLDGLDLSRNILNNLSLGQQWGKQYSGWEKPVISNNQVTYLRDFVPRSNKATSLVPQIMAYLGQSSGNGY